MTSRADIIVRRGARRLAVLALALAPAALSPTFSKDMFSMVGVAAAATAAPAPEQGLLCRDAIRRAEAGSALPAHLLAGIARVESGRRDPVSGRVHPWPWTINAQGEDHIFDTKAAAVAFAAGLRARGLPSFDVGCLQVNLMYHPDAFQSLEEAFDPLANARYAVKFLTELHARTGGWDTAAAWYHSANPAEGTPYRAKVVMAMAEEAATPADAASNPALPAYGQAARFPGTGFSASMPGIGIPGMAAAPRSLPGRPGDTMMAGAMIASGGMASGGMAGRGVAPAGAATLGRGLDAYRMHPVAIVGARLLAAR